MNKSIKVAFAGNPNVGKTSLLNYAAKTDLKVGNWSGVTVEKREGFMDYKGYDIHFVDLPGIYTLEPLSEDEWVAYNFLTKENPDVVVDVIETTNAERDLLLTTELLEFGRPMVVALNMVDEAARRGIEIDSAHSSELLNVPVIRTNGRTGQGVAELLDAIIDSAEGKALPKPVKYNDKIEEALSRISARGELAFSKETERHDGTVDKHTLIKLLSQGDGENLEKTQLEKFYKKNIQSIVKEERYAFANGFYNEVFKKKKSTARDITDQIDKVVLHPYWGLAVFLFVMFLLFKVSFDFSNPLMNWTTGLINDFASPLISSLLLSIGASRWIMNFFSEAIVGGVGFVITFVPLIGAIYFLLALLEMSGYMPRIAFLMDRFMHRLGLHGRGMIPLLLGFGCNVPAVIATRTLENKRDKMLVMAMIPFMSCPARLVIFSFFAILFFDHPAVVIFSLYLAGILIGLLTAFFLRKTAYKGILSHFVMELPPYRVPRIRTVLRITWVQVKSFLYRAGTLIFAASVAVWVLLNTPPNIKSQSDSAAAYIGKAITPIFKPIGINDWRISTSLIPAFLAREIVLSSMGTIYSEETQDLESQHPQFRFFSALGGQAKSFGTAVKESFASLLTPTIQTLQTDEGTESLRAVIRSSFTPASALSFMIFLLLYTSCLATVAVMIREGGRTFGFLFLGYSFAIAWFVAFVVYNVGALI
ncbi:MAG TPA: ferrous iron transport protein B [Candidatus Acidoferrales bacterium]|nr:ferrous iron transport protein B [Candidatus Acidoferrales bacterium]